MTTPEIIELTRNEQDLMNGNNDFAFNLFRQAHNETDNLLLSPLSITFALGMLNNGAAGETQIQINKVLGFGNTGADGINAFCRKVLKAAPLLDPSTKVKIANTIYMNSGYKLCPEFVKKAKTFYDAEPETRNFHDGKTLDVINRWASKHTDKMIPQILDADSFDPDCKSYLLNAVYFKGQWKNPFEKEETTEQAFYKAGQQGEKLYLPMMHQMETFAYSETEDCQALRMPFGNGSYAMTVLLRKQSEEQVTNILPEVPTTETWNLLNASMSHTRVDVLLPRFETGTDINLRPIMQALGMPNAFDETKAEFPDFCTTPSFIHLMKQVSKIKLDEEGAEAAAVTVIGMKDSAPGPDLNYVSFHANRPFLYIISEQQSGAIFFIGQYTGSTTEYTDIP